MCAPAFTDRPRGPSSFPASLPAVLAGTTLYYNKRLTDAGRAVLIGSAAVTTAFGIYLLIWAMS